MTYYYLEVTPLRYTGKRGDNMSYCHKPELMTVQYVIYGLIKDINHMTGLDYYTEDLYTELVDSIDQYNKLSRDHATTHRFDYWRRCELIHRDEKKPLKVVFEWSVV